MNTIAINSWLSSLVVLTDGWLGWRWLGWWRWWRRWWRWRRRGWCGHLAEFPPWRGLAQGYGMSSLHLLRGVLGQVFHNWKKEMCQWFDWVWIIKHDEISVLDTRCAAKDKAKNRFNSKTVHDIATETNRYLLPTQCDMLVYKKTHIVCPFRKVKPDYYVLDSILFCFQCKNLKIYLKLEKFNSMIFLRRMLLISTSTGAVNTSTFNIIGDVFYRGIGVKKRLLLKNSFV